MSRQEIDGVSRRRFLSHSLWSVGLLTSSDWTARPLSETTPSETTDIALAYWRESESLSKVDAIAHTTLPFFVDDTQTPLPEGDGPAGANAALVDARRLPSGDPRFIGLHARFQFHGMFLEPDASLFDVPPLSIHVRAGETPGFHAWSFESASAPNVSSPVSFDVPVSPGGIGLELRTREGSIETTLIPGTALFAPKLRRGVYFLSWARSTGASLSRSKDLLWAEADDGKVRTRLASRSRRAEPLAHVLLSIDRIDRGEL